MQASGVAATAVALATAALGLVRSAPPDPAQTPPATREVGPILRAPRPSGAGGTGATTPFETSPEMPAEPKQRGIALGMNADDVGFSYTALVREIAALGATHIELVVPVYQTDATASDPALHTRWSPTLEQLADTVRAARREHLEVLVLPVARVLRSAPRAAVAHGAGAASAPAPMPSVQPRDPAAWLRAWAEVLGDIAAVAAQTGATRLGIGSELSALDTDAEPWRPLVERIRGVFAGKLIYAAAWDHYRAVKLFDLVDEDGVAARFPLRANAGAPAGDVELEAAWRRHKRDLDIWHAGRSNPLVFTELAYRSRAGATAAPWDERPGGTPDLDEQRRAFAAFGRVWARDPVLAGAYVGDWFGWGGPRSTTTTPRGKPAETEIRKLLGAL